MPLYDFDCGRHIFERFVKLSDFEAPQTCPCGSPATRVISTPMISVDNTGYTCPITDKWIGSKYAHSENLKLHGCRVLETGEKESNQREKASVEADLDRRIDETVEREWDRMPSASRERVSNELTSGMDLSVVRQSA